jgi:hypothetical protein
MLGAGNTAVKAAAGASRGPLGRPGHGNGGRLGPIRISNASGSGASPLTLWKDEFRCHSRGKPLPVQPAATGLTSGYDAPEDGDLAAPDLGEKTLDDFTVERVELKWGITHPEFRSWNLDVYLR